MTRMFLAPDGKRFKVWNPQTGCLHDCYNGGCWAKHLVGGRLKDTPKYQGGFVPTFHYQELLENFRPNEWVFVSDMGDLFGEWVEENTILEVLNRVSIFPQTNFLFLTKNPKRYLELVWYIKDRDGLFGHIYLGTTLETNRHYSVYSPICPSVNERYMALNALPREYKRFVSIEPIMDFDSDVFLEKLRDISPSIVEIGADSLHNNLPEPSLGKIQALITELKKFVPYVIEKQGLERLKK